ncbi:S8 family peptidase [Blastococcus saxobsidens]|uniref:S8 family peptidase n=1 Tax=Blastococcus saxobsidens TaxID=138336 RepID=A0A6L9W6U8_9ACTN|nr:S8 family peptidase [Blastococcus saxobsidens]
MTDPRPLLSFGGPDASPIPPLPDGSRSVPPSPRGPGPARQGARLTPQFDALQDAMQAGRAALSRTASDPDPELVVVFDLAGSVEEFARAVSGVPGLEFLAEHEEEDVDPDADFHMVSKDGRTDKAVPESLYMIMTNARAVTQLIALFHRWEADPEEKFARGLNPLRRVFALLREIRRWGPEDRVRETGLLEDWADTLQAIGGARSSVRIEIELWFRADPARRAAAQSEVARLIGNAGGTVVHTSTIASIDYHGVLADLPHREVQAVLTDGPHAIELLTTDAIMFVAPAQPMAIPGLELAADTPAPAVADGPVGDAPRVALLDGVPLANHSSLAGRLVLDDPDNIAARYVSSQQQHGTAMASLIVHGDLGRPRAPLSARLYVRPIFEPHPSGNGETVIQDQLQVDLVHRAFHRMFEGDGDQPPAAPSVRIVNLSIGDPARVFVRRLSPMAKLLDWLAHRYNLLVLVSAGNHPIATTVPTDAISDPGSLGRVLVADGRDRALHRRLLAPAEAVNVVTVGALHADAWSGDLPDTVLDGLEDGMPALYSAVGFGYRRSVKPEVLLPGGRSLFQRPPAVTSTTVPLSPARTSARGPGMLVAAPGRDRDATAYLYGTSNATALASRSASHIFDVLAGLPDRAGEFPFPDAQYHPVLAKTLLVHAATWGALSTALRDALDLETSTERRDITQMLGYGAVDPHHVASASRTRVVLLGAGSITKDQRHRFSFPMPPALAATTEWRRLTVTLGWLSPVNTRTQRHRMARLFFQPPQTELGVKRVQAQHQTVRKGTVQHEVLEGAAAVAFAAGDALTVDVDCRVDAGRLDAPVRYGLAVSLEVAATVQADIHAQVREQLQARLRQRAAAQVTAVRG